MRYEDFETARRIPNVVVDGSPNESTVLTLTHWPGIEQPAGLARDLSAEMAFAYLDDPIEHPPADVVTNNHFDQDGLISIFALVNPADALAHRELLVDVAAAGDFATYRDRRAARAAMAMARRGAAETTCSYSEFTHQLYRALLPDVLPMVLDTERFRSLWEDEDAELTASEHALESGRATIEEHAELDLAIVRIDPELPEHTGHRFGHGHFTGLHPMAIHNATERFRLLLVHGDRFRYVDRYETWVQYASRPTLPRFDLRPVADELTALERDGATWSAPGPEALTPELAPDRGSSLSEREVLDTLTTRLTDVVSRQE